MSIRIARGGCPHLEQSQVFREIRVILHLAFVARQSPSFSQQLSPHTNLPHEFELLSALTTVVYSPLALALTQPGMHTQDINSYGFHALYST